jgi:hypothetical protein
MGFGAWQTGSYTNNGGDRLYDSGIGTNADGYMPYEPAPTQSPVDFYKRSSSSSSSSARPAGGLSPYGGGAPSSSRAIDPMLYFTPAKAGGVSNSAFSWAHDSTMAMNNAMMNQFGMQQMQADMAAQAGDLEHRRELEKYRMQMDMQARRDAEEWRRQQESERMRIASQERMQQRGFTNEDYQGAAELYRGHGIRMGDVY